MGTGEKRRASVAFSDIVMTQMRTDISTQGWTQDHVEGRREGQIDQEIQSNEEGPVRIVSIVIVD